jgi:hypothetical protein
MLFKDVTWWRWELDISFFLQLIAMQARCKVNLTFAYIIEN